MQPFRTSPLFDYWKECEKATKQHTLCMECAVWFAITTPTLRRLRAAGPVHGIDAVGNRKRLAWCTYGSITCILGFGILRRMYPVLRDIALFFEDFLIEADGKLVTCPSVSPENRYILPDGYDTPICAGPAMDNQILREFFSALIKIQNILGVDADLSERLAAIIERLPKDKIGSKGQLLEWIRNTRNLHRMGHISHLFACYPGNSINGAIRRNNEGGQTIV